MEEQVIIQRRTISLNAYLKSLPRKKKKAYKKELKKAFSCAWKKEPIDIRYCYAML